MEKRTPIQAAAGVAAGGTFVTAGAVSAVGFDWVKASVTSCRSNPPQLLSCHISGFIAFGSVSFTLILLLTSFGCWAFSKPKQVKK